MIVALIGTPTKTNVELAYAWRELGVDARILWPREALDVLGPSDTAITRLDVLPTLDGIEPGLEVVDELGRQGVRVLNRADGVLAAHDKLETARRLAAAGVPHPRTIHLEAGRALPPLPLPCVLKPRFGSWGQDVLRCRSLGDVRRCLELVRDRPWWRKHGAVAQALVEPADRDVRVVVAGETAVAGGERIAAEGEWRTNVTLGGRVVKTGFPLRAAQLALRAARAAGLDFVGVDLLPAGEGFVVLELNGAVDFDSRYALPGLDPYEAILRGLGIAVPAWRDAAREGTLVPSARKEVPMTKTTKGKPARPGDEILVSGHSVGTASRTAVILEVLGEPGHERYRVRWEDDHESIYFPGEDAVIRRPQRRRTAASA